MTPALIAHLEATGRWNTDGVARRVRSRQCADCGSWTIVGLDADRCAGAATCDPTPLTALGETVALLSGRTTYRLAHRAGRLEFDHRHQWAVRGETPESGPFDIVADHRCHLTTAPELTAASRLVFHQSARFVTSDVAPF